MLQEQVEHQAEQLEELHKELEERDAEGDELRQALNLERFKYELLVDLVSRVFMKCRDYVLRNVTGLQLSFPEWQQFDVPFFFCVFSLCSGQCECWTMRN